MQEKYCQTRLVNIHPSAQLSLWDEQTLSKPSNPWPIGANKYEHEGSMPIETARLCSLNCQYYGPEGIQELVAETTIYTHTSF